MKAKLVALIVIFVTNFRICQSKRYDNFTLFGVVPIEVDHLKFLQNLEKQKYIDMVFWKRPFKLYHDVQFIVNPADKDLFMERARHFKMHAEVLAPDVQKAFDNQTIRRYLRLRVETYSWEFYHTLEDIYQWLSDLALKFPNIVELYTIGKSAEGREIFAVGIKKGRTAREKVIIEGGVHGNEWVSTEFVTYLARELIYCNATKNARIHHLAERYQWFLIPVVNPDGYDYSQKVDRLWRKNRRSLGGGVGVDLNRNFDYSFGKHAASPDPKDEQYCGPTPFSEPESKALSQFVNQKQDHLKFYFAFHGYGQKLVIPYADRVNHVEDYSEMENYGKQAIVKMYRLYKKKYSVGTFYDTLGFRISGNSASWVKKTHRVKYVFTFLLRDNGSYGYALPPDQIAPTCKETLTGLVEIMTASKMHIKIFILLLYFYSNVICKKYSNYTLYRGMPVNEEDLEFFNNISSLYNVNFWRPPSTLYRPIEFIVSPEYQKDFIADANKHAVYLTTIIPDLQRAFDKQTVKSYIRRNMESFDWRSFFRLRDIYSWLKDLSKQNPTEVKMFSIGKTYENRNIYAVRIILRGSKRRSKVIVEGGIHAREWISPAFVTYMMYEILYAPSKKNKELLDIAMTYEWYFVPVLNPDGYEYSHTEDRLWRKNRERGYGVDINRNFAYAFGSIGVSNHKYSDIYCGPSAFSEKESQAMGQFVESHSQDLEYYLGFHSYGQFMIIPYAHSIKHQDNYDEVKKMGVSAAWTISRRYGTQYSVGTAYDTVGYRTSGVSGCWVKRTFKVPYVVTMELRDNGEDGFALPPKLILPTCRETMDGLLSLLKPRTPKYQKMKVEIIQNNHQENTMFDVFVLVFNLLLFIIVRYE
ncbi:uncharacterized protein LOC135080360 [Ostrinia nubilalis]|uniref:uncharacterized protein LOC135080360 n=1 Tax=Ostrinia nubilalis TaxID=29057 RepID=UPI0030823B0A